MNMVQYEPYRLPSAGRGLTRALQQVDDQTELDIAGIRRCEDLGLAKVDSAGRVIGYALVATARLGDIEVAASAQSPTSSANVGAVAADGVAVVRDILGQFAADLRHIRG